MLSKFREMVRQRRDRERLYSTAEFWDRKAHLYAGSAVSMWPNETLNALYQHEQSAAIESLAGDLRGLRILDLGCGTGRFSRWLVARGAVVTGIDFSGAALEITRTETAD